MVNFNNPQQLSLSNSCSTVSATLDNPAVAQTIEYGDFSSADPSLAVLLPKNLNLGITSPGTVNMETDCNGLDFMNTNPNFNKLPFSVCLDKFNDQYRIPEMTFNNLMNNLPYTFSALSKEEQQRYLDSLQKFINTQSKRENFVENLNETKTKNKSKTDSKSCLNKKENEMILRYSIYYFIIIIIVIILFMFFIAKKN